MEDVSSAVLVSFDYGTATLTLNAPARRNALSTAMREQLLVALQRFQHDPACRCIILTGAGGTFCSGGDISEMTPPEGISPGDHARYRIELLQDIVRLLVRCRVPTVAMVAGNAAGAGMSIACACDYVIAERDARFAASFTKLGLIADCGLTWTLPRRAGPVRAQDLLMTGRTIGAEEAYRLGVVDALADQGAGMVEAWARAKVQATAAPRAVARTKAALLEQPASLNEALSIELREQAVLRLTKDHAEARAAFAEKRPPSFTGE